MIFFLGFSVSTGEKFVNGDREGGAFQFIIEVWLYYIFRGLARHFHGYLE